MITRRDINPGDRVRVNVDGQSYSVIYDHDLAGDLVGYSRGKTVRFSSENIAKIENRLGVRNVVRAF